MQKAVDSVNTFSKEQLKQKFNMWDHEGTGTITRSKLMMILDRPGPNRLSKQACQEFMDAFDANGDGLLSYEEICAAIADTPEERLRDAVRCNDATAIERMLGDGFQLEALAKDELPPLHMACARGHVDVVRVLLTSGGIDVNARTDSTKAIGAGHLSPLFCAVRGEYAPGGKRDSSFGQRACCGVVQQLLAARADVHTKTLANFSTSGNGGGLSPLHYAARIGDDVALEVVNHHYHRYRYRCRHHTTKMA